MIPTEMQHCLFNLFWTILQVTEISLIKHKSLEAEGKTLLLGNEIVLISE
jgi:hypothetical protein